MPVIYEPKGRAREYSPLALNLYRGCIHGCVYCYAPACLYMTPINFKAHSEPRKNIIAQLREDAPKYRNAKNHVLLSFTSDPYQPNEDGLTREALAILRENDVPFQVLTKGGTRACRDLDLYIGHRAKFGTTLVFTEEADREKWEPNAAPIADRIEAINTFHDAGVLTWISIEPVIDTEQAKALVPMLADVVDFWKVGKLNYHPHATTINWHKFATEIVGELEKVGAKYLIKNDLKKFLQ